MNLRDFFRTVITTDEGWFCLAYAEKRDGEEETRQTWTEEFFKWPTDSEAILKRISALGDDKNIYYSPHLFSVRRSRKEDVLPTRTIIADLDDANILTLAVKPTVLVETSTERHQGYWVLKDELPLEEHENLSKRITYNIPRCDRTGWYLGKKVRVPGTMNWKYFTGPKLVRIVDESDKKYMSEELLEIPAINELFGDNVAVLTEENLDWVEEAQNLSIGPQELLMTIRNSLPIRVVTQYNMLSSDRSSALYALMTSAFRAGMDRARVFHLAYHSANNKFKDLRYGGIKELAKDVMRAEMAVMVKLPDIKAKIADARKINGTPVERSEYIAKLVREHLEGIGTLIHCIDDTEWYVRKDNGRPVILNVRSDHLKNMLDVLFGLNASEKESPYVMNSLTAFVSELSPNGRVAALSHYDHNARSFMLHTGRKDVLQVTKDGITKVTNGYDNIVFPWGPNSDSIDPKYQALERTWDEELLDGCLDNVLDIKKEEAQAILKTWFLSILLRDGLVSRPILALLGQPGSGKSTLFRRVYALLYGRHKSLGAVSNESDFDHAVANEALVVLDNVDTSKAWLPDRMAVSASTSDIIKRKLFTDTDVIVLRRQAMLAVTAHNPKFGREDIIDRMLILTFERLRSFRPETEIIERIISMRDALWGDILTDIQKVLSTKIPETGYPQFRIEDFSRYGYWIASTLGFEKAFYDGIGKIRDSQKTFTLEEDGLLVDAIRSYIEKTESEASWKTPGQLWKIFEVTSGNPNAFVRRYSNAVALGKKLWTMQASLKEVFIVEWQYNSHKGIREWRFDRLPVTNGVHATPGGNDG